MIAANIFWLDTLHECKIDQSLSLPFDRYRLLNKHRSGRGISISFDFGQHLSHDFLTYSLSNNMTTEQLALAIYYVLLFKLANGERDLCIGMTIDNRYRDEFKSLIGLFENIIPLRCQLDLQWSFDELMKYVNEIITNSMNYSYYPVQRILRHYPHISKAAFLDTTFEFRLKTNDNSKNGLMIDDSRLHSIPISIKISEDEIVSKFDFAAIIEHDLNINQLSCTINASLDLFDIKTIDKISQRFHSMLKQLFNIENSEMKKPLYELSLTLPNERLLMQSVNNTEVLFPSMNCIHHEFVSQVIKHPQKLAVELDEQSLTYGELLYYVQILSSNLLNNHVVIPGEIICQCVERSLSMVS